MTGAGRRDHRAANGHYCNSHSTSQSQHKLIVPMYTLELPDQDAAAVAMRKNLALTSGECSENGTKPSSSSLPTQSGYPSRPSESVIDFTEPPNFSSPHPTCISK